MDTDVRGASEVWVAVRRHFLNKDRKPCSECGRTSVHELIGIGVAMGNKSAEEMAAEYLCFRESDYIYPMIPNVALPENAFFVPGAYCPLDLNRTAGEVIPR